jgi:L-fuculose-phosphate aldolase
MSRGPTRSARRFVGTQMGTVMFDKERQDVVDACQRLSRERLVVGTAGNVSIKVGDRIVISPSGLAYDELRPELVCVVELDGTQVEGPLKPSSEVPLHLRIYQTSQVAAIVHTHAPASTALSVVVGEVPASHYYTGLFGGGVRVAPYATFGTDELADNVATALANRSAALMSNHGAIVVGSELPRIMDLVPYLEYICDVQLRAMSAGRPLQLLDPKEIAHVTELLGSYGQAAPPSPRR